MYYVSFKLPYTIIYLYKISIIIISIIELLYFNFTIIIIWSNYSSFKNKYTFFYIGTHITYSS